MIRTKRRVEPVLALLLLFGVGATVPLLLGRPAAVEAQTRAGGKIVFAARQDIDTLDPHITNRAATRKILIQFMDTLTVIRPKDGTLSPGLAESWDV